MADERTISVEAFDAVIFDLDGVVTRTARIHARAWKRVFDEYLEQLAERSGERFEPFDIERDYAEFVDGKPRYDGVRSFLASRGIELPEGDPGEPDPETVRCSGAAVRRRSPASAGGRSRSAPGWVSWARPSSSRPAPPA